MFFKSVKYFLLTTAFIFLPSLVISANVRFDVDLVVEGCNNNFVCELVSGETASNCPSDCTNLQCSDGIDNDGDGLVDFPNDSGCLSLLDNSEQSVVAGGGGSKTIPKCFMSVTPAQIYAGDLAWLSWNSSDASLKRTILPAIGDVSNNGSLIVSPNKTTTYIGNFIGNGGQVACTAKLEVLPKPESSGLIQWSNEVFFVEESAGSVMLGLERVGGNSGQLKVLVKTVPLSADERDYQSFAKEFVFDDGDSDAKVVKVNINQDIFEEDPESFLVIIEEVSVGAVGFPYEALVTIKDKTVLPPDFANLTLIKKVDNSQGGNLTAEDFPLLINKQQVKSGTAFPVKTNKSVLIEEKNQPNYRLSHLVGNGCPSNLPEEVNLLAGIYYYCVIYNAYVPDSKDVLFDRVGFINSYLSVEEGKALAISLLRQTNGINRLGVSIKEEPISLQKDEYSLSSNLVFWEAGLSGTELIIFRTSDDNFIEEDEVLRLSITLTDESEVEVFNKELVIVIKDNDFAKEGCIGVSCFVNEPVFDRGLPTEISGLVEIGSYSFYTNDQLRLALNLLAWLGVLSGVAMFLKGIGWWYFWVSWFRLIRFVLWLIGFNDKKHLHGLVFDVLTYQPVSLIVIKLVNDQGEVVEKTITDSSGRYYFSKFEERSHLEVSHPDYQMAELGDRFYYHFKPVYSGNKLEGEYLGQVAWQVNIPVKPKHHTLNWVPDKNFVKKLNRQVVWQSMIRRLSLGLFLLGLVAMNLLFLWQPVVLNFIGWLLVWLLVWLRLEWFDGFRVSVLKKSKKLLPFGLVEFRNQEGYLVKDVVADVSGRFYLRLPSGKYNVSIWEKTEDGHRLLVVKEITHKGGSLPKIFKI